MGELWSDLKLALGIMFFIYTITWLSGMTGSKKLGILIAAVVAYLTFFSHFELLIVVLILFFCFPVFEKAAEGIEYKGGGY